MSQTQLTLQKLGEKKQKQEKISALTCYDYTFAHILDQMTSVDFLLVGDSLGMVVQGRTNTLNTTIDDMVYHTRLVSRGVKRAHVCADMPFLSYQVDENETVRNAGKLIQAGAQSVKLEGCNLEVIKSIRRLVALGIPVVGHIGLTPQHIHAFGGFKVQGKTKESQNRLKEAAFALEDAGISMLVIECTPNAIAKEIASKLQIPVIGIGAGGDLDGQILVLYDALGLNPNFKPKFVKRFMNGAELVQEACQNYANSIQSGSFPTDENSFS